MSQPKSALTFVLLIKEQLSQIDDIHALMKRGHGAHISMAILREMSSVLRELSPDLQDEYLRILVTIATADGSRPRQVSVCEDFIKNSASIKSRFAQRLRGNLVKVAAH